MTISEPTRTFRTILVNSFALNLGSPLRTIAVSGAAGFIGGYLTETLTALGAFSVTPTSRDGSVGEALDVTDSTAVSRFVRRTKPDWFIHLAGRTHGDAAHVLDVNVRGAQNVLEAVRCGSPESRVLLAGSAAEYGLIPASRIPVTEDEACLPRGTHGISKHYATLLALHYAQQYGLGIVVARPFNVIGPGQPASTVLGAIVARVQKGSGVARDSVVQIPVGPLDAIRDFVTLEDVGRGLVGLMCPQALGQVVNLCSGVPRSVRSIAERFVRFAPVRVELKEQESPRSPRDVPAMVGSWHKAHDLCGFTPTTDLDPTMRSMWSSACLRHSDEVME